CATAIKPPSSAYRGGSHPCSIQHSAAHISPQLSHTPYQGCPNSFQPSARNSDCAGGYLLAYVGWKFSWKVSKCTHMGCGGFVTRPRQKVSAPSREANSSWTAGCGIGRTGSSARRSSRANEPTARHTHPDFF